MNKREDILDAWITIEKLSERTINKRDINFDTIDEPMDDWKQFLTAYFEKKKEYLNVKPNKVNKAGLILYFGIFDFQEIEDLLRENYQIKSTNDEVISTDKFTLALYFDHELNFLPDHLFLTMSGFFKETKMIVDSKALKEREDTYKEQYARDFEEDFNKTLTNLARVYDINKNNFRLCFKENIEMDDVNLHSFFIEDLLKANTLSSMNLTRYFEGFQGERYNLDSRKNSPNYNRSIFSENILQPKKYPLGRFPTNPQFALSFMQQTAVNLAVNDSNTIQGVNGPPGTGKTTLLKDIFAEFIVEQAEKITNLRNKELKRELVYYDKGKMAVLPNEISDKNIVVASSNNGAVQNIVRELPKKSEIANEFHPLLEEVDYFKNIMNAQHTNVEDANEENWGLFSLEGGASKNMTGIVTSIKSILEYFDKDFQPDASIYERFINLLEKVKAEQQEAQKFSEQMQQLHKLEEQQIQKQTLYKKELLVKEKEKDVAELNENANLSELSMRKMKWDQEVRLLDKQLIEKEEECIDCERAYEIAKLAKPSFFTIKKIMNTKGFQAYARELKEVHTQLKQCKDLMRQSKSNKESIQEKLKHNFDEMKEISFTLQKIKQDFSEWVEKSTHTIQQLQERITKLNDELVQQGRPFIDFSQSYEQLQKSNAWYSTGFRKMQSELFILALGVRKQFLYENHKSLKGAINVWERQPVTIGKVNGDELITASWQWINFTVPVISTTFASFGRMFKNLHVDTVSNLFIDEAGQALPQASVGAVFRSKRIFAVGDPSQIKPVLTIPPSILTLISRHHDVNEKFISANASTQTIVDDASQFGYFKNKEEWIGIPLWVHRRCNDPMFTISNEISYNGLMVQGKDADSIGKAKWLHVEGKAIDKFVKEQAVRLKEEIQKMMEIDPKLKDDIYVISPFRNVAKKLENELKEINFVKKKGNKCVNVGTVHTFQGKEAKIVFFVLGADNDSRGAASWAVSEPNLMNVAVTRAKEQFYIIGDKKLYADLKSDVADKSIAILEAHNAL